MVHVIDYLMLCERPYFDSKMLRDIPYPKYKQRYDQYGRPDIYGEYDINRMYRAYEYSDDHAGGGRTINPRKRKQPDDDELITIQLFPSSEEEIPSFGLGAGDTEGDNGGEESTIVSHVNDDYAGDESSGGEFPPGYYEMNNNGYIIEQEEEPPRPTACHQCQREESNTEDSRRMREALRDIKNIIIRPLSVPEDADWHLRMVRDVLHAYETNTSIVPDPIRAYDSIKKAKKEEESLTHTKKKLKRDENIDIEFRLRVDNTDCFHCILCDPLSFNTIRLNSWYNHCQLSVHMDLKKERLAQSL